MAKRRGRIPRASSMSRIVRSDSGTIPRSCLRLMSTLPGLHFLKRQVSCVHFGVILSSLRVLLDNADKSQNFSSASSNFRTCFRRSAESMADSRRDETGIAQPLRRGHAPGPQFAVCDLRFQMLLPRRISRKAPDLPSFWRSCRVSWPPQPSRGQARVPNLLFATHDVDLAESAQSVVKTDEKHLHFHDHRQVAKQRLQQLEAVGH